MIRSRSLGQLSSEGEVRRPEPAFGVPFRPLRQKLLDSANVTGRGTQRITRTRRNTALGGPKTRSGTPRPGRRRTAGPSGPDAGHRNRRPGRRAAFWQAASDEPQPRRSPSSGRPEPHRTKPNPAHIPADIATYAWQRSGTWIEHYRSGRLAERRDERPGSGSRELRLSATRRTIRSWPTWGGLSRCSQPLEPERAAVASAPVLASWPWPPAHLPEPDAAPSPGPGASRTGRLARPGSSPGPEGASFTGRDPEIPALAGQGATAWSGPLPPGRPNSWQCPAVNAGS
jgi:hypothetical protein